VTIWGQLSNVNRVCVCVCVYRSRSVTGVTLKYLAKRQLHFMPVVSRELHGFSFVVLCDTELVIQVMALPSKVRYYGDHVANCLCLQAYMLYM
jgi:hypothetical protein